MYAVGTISSIAQGSTSYSRNNAFSFSQTTGQVTNWNPNVNGTVNDIALSPDCSTAYLGGKFTSAGGQAATNLAAVDTTTGALKTILQTQRDSRVYTMDYVQGQVLVGGAFSMINGTARTEFASLNPSTGVVTPYANLAISGAYHEQQQTHRQFTAESFRHQTSRRGSFHLDKRSVAPTDGGFRSRLDECHPGRVERSRSQNACFSSETYYVRAGAWSPDDATIYGASTGYKPASGPGSNTSDPRAGLCDAAFSFSSAPAAQCNTVDQLHRLRLLLRRRRRRFERLRRRS